MDYLNFVIGQPMIFMVIKTDAKGFKMLVWCVILFVLGITAFMDSLFNYGEIFRRVNSVLFMLISLGLLVRTTTKMKSRRVENYLEKMERLSTELRNLRSQQSEKQITEDSQAKQPVV